MQVLVADNEITSRVMVETALRERGHTVRNCDDGFEAARLLSAQYAPRVAILSNSLSRLRGLDVCRFLCATGKKNGVYVILVTDVLDMELVELCRRAGVDDVITRSISVAGLHSHFDIAGRVAELEDEINRIQGILHGLANVPSALDKKAAALRDANAVLLDAFKKKTELAGSMPAEKTGKVEQSISRDKPVLPINTSSGKVFRGVSIVPGKEAHSAPSPMLPVGGKSLLGTPVTAKKPSQSEIDEIMAGGHSSVADYSSRPFVPMTPTEAAPQPAPFFTPPPELSAAEVHDEAQQAVLAGAEQLQNEELADEEIIHPFEFDDIILNVFSGMGVTLKTEMPPKPLAEGAIFASWVGIAIAKQPVWMDVLLVAGERVAKAITKELLGQSKVTDSDVCEMFAELQNMVQGALRRYLEENGHKPVLQLAIPCAHKRDEPLPSLPELTPAVESGFSLNGDSVNALLFLHRETSVCDDLSSLQPYDFMCEPVRVDGSKDDVLMAGVIFKEREKGLVAAAKGKPVPFKVMRVSPFAKAIGAATLLGK